MSDLLDNFFTQDLSNTLFDFPKQGFIDNYGQIAKVYGNDALENAVNIWIKSQRGERLRDPIGGGYIVPLLKKPVNEDTQTQLTEAIVTGFEQDFQPLLTLQSLEVIPLDSYQWNIKISALSKDLKISVNVDEIVGTQE